MTATDSALSGARVLTRSPALLWLLTALTALLFLASLCIGPLLISPFAVLRHLAPGDDSTLAMIVRDIRLPRALLAVLVGASLGCAGAALQGLLRNPLS